MLRAGLGDCGHEGCRAPTLPDAGQFNMVQNPPDARARFRTNSRRFMPELPSGDGLGFPSAANKPAALLTDILFLTHLTLSRCSLVFPNS
jgi:hypothetical protein